MPERNAVCPKPCMKVRHLFSAIRHRGKGFIALWRINGPSQDRDEGLSTDQEEAPAPLPMYLMDPIIGHRISRLLAAALCVKPRRQMTTRQIVNLDASQAASAEFTTMRHLAMRFRGLLRGGTVEKLDVRLRDAPRSGIYGIQRFAKGIAARHRGRAECRAGTVEQWADRRPDQLAQDAEEGHVRPCRC
jgi:hypothetical protein